MSWLKLCFAQHPFSCCVHGVSHVTLATAHKTACLPKQSYRLHVPRESACISICVYTWWWWAPYARERVCSIKQTSSDFMNQRGRCYYNGYIVDVYIRFAVRPMRWAKYFLLFMNKLSSNSDLIFEMAWCHRMHLICPEMRKKSLAEHSSKWQACRDAHDDKHRMRLCWLCEDGADTSRIGSQRTLNHSYTTHTHTYTDTRTATTQPHCRTHSHAYGWTWGSLASVHRHRMRTFLSGHFLWHTELIHIQLHSGTWVGSIVGAYIHSSSRTKSVIGTDRLADRNKQHRSAYCESDFTLWRFRFCRLV